jgi:hypothetical protein
VLACSVRSNARVKGFVLGIYRKEQYKAWIDSVVEKFFGRVRLRYPGVSIIIFGDLNESNIVTLSKKWKISCSRDNLNIITRSQNRLGNTLESTLDFFLSNEKLSTSRLESRGNSDHFPLMCKTQFNMKTVKRSKYFRKRVIRNPKEEDVKMLLEDEDWPLVCPSSDAKKNFYSSMLIRPKIYLNVKGIDRIVESSSEWDEFRSKILKMYKENYKEYLQDLNDLAINNSKKFFKCLNQIVNYKSRAKIVKQVKDNIILGKEESCRALMTYYEKLFESNVDLLNCRCAGSNLELILDIDRGLERLARNKAVGVDMLPGDWLRIGKDILRERLSSRFEECIAAG